MKKRNPCARLSVLCALMLLCLSAPAQAALWFGDSGVPRLHRDPYCTWRNWAVPDPYETIYPFDSLQSLYGSGWMPCAHCSVYASDDPRTASPDSFSAVWNATLEEKAAMLPGVWTLPSSGAISADEAFLIAKAYVASAPAFGRALNSKGLCTVCIMHYDAASAHPQEQRETYKALVTTTLREPVGLVYIDALTGEVYCAIVSD